jgi:hypothetical protein
MPRLWRGQQRHRRCWLRPHRRVGRPDNTSQEALAVQAEAAEADAVAATEAKRRAAADAQDTAAAAQALVVQAEAAEADVAATEAKRSSLF